jgi:dienelactone hydrolase
MTKLTRALFVLVASLACTGASALEIKLTHVGKVETQTIEYKSGDMTFEGYVARPKGPSSQKFPGVLVIHNWLGLSEETKSKARAVAEMGYVAFAVDVFGKGVRPAQADAAKNTAAYYSDRKMFRERLALGLEQLKKQRGVNTSKLGAIGYCFGGTGALELARSGADIRAAVSFHGGLDSPTPGDAKNIKASVLALHGADDPYVPDEKVAAFEKEMREAKVDWQLIKYSGAVHSFTEKAAGDDNSKGAAYNEKADRRSFQAMRDLFSEKL